MNFEPTRNQLAVVLPATCRKAEVTFQKRFDAGDEVRLTLAPCRLSRQVIPTGQLSTGLWHVILNWWDGKSHYWREQDIMVQ
ncbi:hypothetical protein [Larkinella soli]|uniref:hypothetical protein n=1 Tax=Larkinella soli TaxID=1770527 RepID=UPI000FFBF64B|nr:hypothetical protein [Larkinella soli]